MGQTTTLEREYAHGHSSRVFSLTPEQKLHFPQADLVRVETAPNQHVFRMMIQAHRIAHTLFPANFIEVVGAQTRPNGDEYDFLLYSKKADVPDDHATFTKHFKDHLREGKRYCKCETCDVHRSMHVDMLDQGSFMSQCREISKYGIQLPIGLNQLSLDPTDFCLDSRGNPVFFEMDFFYPHQFWSWTEYLAEDGNLTEQDQKAAVLVRRFEDSFRQAYNREPFNPKQPVPRAA